MHVHVKYDYDILYKKNPKTKQHSLSKNKLAFWGYSTNLHNIKINFVDVINFEKIESVTFIGYKH